MSIRLPDLETLPAIAGPERGPSSFGINSVSLPFMAEQPMEVGNGVDTSLNETNPVADNAGVGLDFPFDALDMGNRIVGDGERLGREIFEEEQEKVLSGNDAPDGFAERVQSRLMKERDTLFGQGPQGAGFGSADDELSQQELGESYGRIADRITRQAASFEQARKVKARADHAEQALGAFSASARANPEDLNALKEEGDQVLNRMAAAGVDPGAVEERRRQFQDQLGTAALSGLVDHDPENAAQRIRDGEFDPWFKDEDGKTAVLKRLDFTRKAQEDDTAALLSARQQEEVRQQQRQRLAFEADVSEKLKTNSLTNKDITKALWEGTIDDGDFVLHQTRLNEAINKRQAETQQITRIQDALKQGTPLNPQDPTTKEAVDAYFDQVLGENAEDQAPAERVVLENHLIHQTGILPQQVLKPIRGGLIAGTPQEQATAARRLQDLLKESPGLEDQLKTVLPEAERARAATLAELSDMGINPQKAVEITTNRHGDPIDQLEL